jgi:diguanylate cyclase (GGDEF)-like protein
MQNKQTNKMKKVKCWEIFKCKKKDCPAYKSIDLRCWLFSRTHCRDEIQGKFLEKMEECINCEVFRKNIDIQNIKNTFNLVNKQLKEFRKLVNDRDKKLEKLATTDKLTGAHNRTKFDEIMDREMERFRRYNEPLSLIMFDIDNFKEINDTYGHSIGDYILQKIAAIARETIRKIDYFVRWGGEEFIVISPETTLEKAHALAKRLRRNVENYRFNKVGKATVSLGVTEFNNRDTIDTLIKRVDDIMYKAKIKGKNRVETSA